MCGGVRFSYDPVYEAELHEAYSDTQIAQFRDAGQVESLFWQARPILPVLQAGQVRIVDWGNRNKQIRLPQTGWVRQESLDAGRWDYLRPEEIIIPVYAGVEKKIWFGIEHGIRGVIVHQGDLRRAYMITHAPTAEFAELTGHDRMPALINQPFVVPLAPVIRQIGLDGIL